MKPREVFCILAIVTCALALVYWLATGDRRTVAARKRADDGVRMGTVDVEKELFG